MKSTLARWLRWVAVCLAMGCEGATPERYIVTGEVSCEFSDGYWFACFDADGTPIVPDYTRTSCKLICIGSGTCFITADQIARCEGRLDEIMGYAERTGPWL